MSNLRPKCLGAMARGGAVGLLAVATLLPGSAAVASGPIKPPTPPTASLPTVDANGVLHYSHLPFASSKLTTLHGTRSPDGTCHFANTVSGVEGQDIFSEEVSFDPVNCIQGTLSGVLTAAGAAVVQAMDSAASSAATDATSAASGLAASRAIYGSSANQSQATASTTYSHYAHSKGRWVDPIYITITSLTANIGWNSTSTHWTSAWGQNVAYKFPWDGWTTSGTPPVVLQSGSGGSVFSDASETFRNVDFELVLVATMGVTAYAACGFNANPAVFDHYREIKGNPSGSWTASWNDSKTGGCSNLVHHSDDNGSGTTT